MKDLKREWIADLREKIDFLDKHPPRVDSYLLPEERNDEVEIKKAKEAMGRKRKQNAEKKEYFLSIIKKVEQLKQNPATNEEKLLWYEIIKELETDFTVYHNGKNRDFGYIGKILLSYIFDIKDENDTLPK